MGLETGDIYVDTSFQNGECQTGFIIKWHGKECEGSSRVFEAPDNNTAEINGVKIALEHAVRFIEKYSDAPPSLYYFNVYNDNITAVTVLDGKYKMSKEHKKKYVLTDEIHKWCIENCITMRCHRMKRGHAMMKRCDRLSKVFRKGRIRI